MTDQSPLKKPKRQIRFLTPKMRERARLERQFAWLRRYSPVLGRIVQTLSKPGWTLVRVPVGFLFILGGFLAILPIFGLWMIPVGLLLLSVDIPRLRRPVAAFLIAMRRRAERWKFRKEP